MKRLVILPVFFALAFATAMAEDHISVGGEVRSCYTFGQGFGGERLSARMSGSIGNRFFYAVYQNFHKAPTKENPLAATDWAQITWQPNEHWAITGGKQMTVIGGFEYYSRAVDILYASQWWDNASVFKPGLTGQYIYKSGEGIVAAEVSASPYGNISDRLYAYSLYWNGGSIGCWTPIWSTNLFQYADKGYVHYVVIGNRFNLGPVTVELDLLHGADTRNYTLFKDWTAIGYARWDVCKMFTLFTKCTYDKTPEDAPYTPIALMGADTYKLGGGFELFPLKERRNVRLHAFYYRHEQGNIQPRLELVV